MVRGSAWLDKGPFQLESGRHGRASAAFLSEEVLFLRAMSDGYAALPTECTPGRNMAQHATTSRTATVCPNCQRRTEGSVLNY